MPKRLLDSTGHNSLISQVLHNFTDTRIASIQAIRYDKLSTTEKFCQPFNGEASYHFSKEKRDRNCSLSKSVEHPHQRLSRRRREKLLLRNPDIYDMEVVKTLKEALIAKVERKGTGPGGYGLRSNG